MSERLTGFEASGVHEPISRSDQYVAVNEAAPAVRVRWALPEARSFTICTRVGAGLGMALAPAPSLGVADGAADDEPVASDDSEAPVDPSSSTSHGGVPQALSRSAAVKAAARPRRWVRMSAGMRLHVSVIESSLG